MNSAIQINEETTIRQRDAFMGKMLETLNGFFDIHTIYLGNRLGFYKPLAGPTSLTAEELAARTGNDERYVREWLEGQIAAEHDETGGSDRQRHRHG